MAVQHCTAQCHLPAHPLCVLSHTFMQRSLLLAMVLAGVAPHSSARKRKGAAAPTPQQPAGGAGPTTLAGISSEIPGAMRSTSTHAGGEAFVRHLFSTPLYVANVSGNVGV